MSTASPRVLVVGLGPAGPDLLDEVARSALLQAPRAFLRTSRHPAAEALAGIPSFDHHYEAADTFDEVYERIVEDLVAAAFDVAADGGTVVYGVPGSPLVAERTVERLRADPRVAVSIRPAVSFLDLAWDRLGVDPLEVGVQLVDGARFRTEAAGASGPLLVAQCWSSEVLSDIKLTLDAQEPRTSVPEVAVLSHLGLEDESVRWVPVDDLDRVAPDDLTSVWVPRLAAPVASELVRLVELVRTLRERCPWDREQTHSSLARHVLEETYELLEAIAEVTEARGNGTDPAPAYAHLEEELGDLLFQVAFHARLAAEAGQFTLAEVAVGVHDKLVSRHPHVFGDVVASTPAAVVANWELIKQAEKGRASVTEGIPASLPALSLAAKLQRKLESLGIAGPSLQEQQRWLLEALSRLPAAVGGDHGAVPDDRQLGEILFAVADLCRQLGREPEDLLRNEARRVRARIVEAESQAKQASHPL